MRPLSPGRPVGSVARVVRVRAGGYFRRSCIRARMDSIVKPRGSTFPGCHSLWPMTERDVQP